MLQGSGFIERIGPELGRVSRRWRAKLDERLGHLGLTQARGIVLLYLSRAGGTLLQGELTERIGIEGPTLVRILDRLQQKGLILRVANPNDRRANRVHITSHAEQTLGEVLRIAAELRGEILAGISEEDIVVLEKVLHQMSHNIGIRWLEE